jgi:hypothetical protein
VMAVAVMVSFTLTNWTSRRCIERPKNDRMLAIDMAI